MQANLNTEINRATVAEVTLTSNLNAEIVRAKGAESVSVCGGSFTNCAALKLAGCITSTQSVYFVTPTNGIPMQVWCDLDGWTLVVSLALIFIVSSTLYFKLS